jgi:Ca-activated chloride channel family protein
MLKFGHPEILWALLSIILFTGLFLLERFLKKRAMKAFGDNMLVKGLVISGSGWRPWVKFMFLMLSLSSLIFALSDPQIGSKLDQVKRKGIELVIALDVSNSMLAEDVYPNRLEAAKMTIEKLVDKLNNDKLGLIVFTGEAYTQLPITSDYVSAKMFLSSINPGIVPVQGTNIAAAIETGIRSFSPQDDAGKVLIIISDGEDHENQSAQMADIAAKKGIVIHTIGMGQPKGAPIPVIDKFGRKDFKTDKDGHVIITKTNDALLQGIAHAGNGIYIRANTSGAILNKIIAQIDKMNKKEIEGNIYSEYDHQYQYFVALAILFLLAEILLTEGSSGKFRALKNISRETL